MAIQQCGDITQILNKGGSSSSEERQRLAELVYGQLRDMARHIMDAERPGHTLQATAIATDAYLELIRDHGVQWCDRFHFFATAARAMRRVLVDHSRRKKAQKRGGGWERSGSADSIVEEVPLRDPEELLDLDQALSRLEERDPRQCHIVELRYFGGLTEEEAADILGMSVRTIKREWRIARAWLFAELTRGPVRSTAPAASIGKAP